MPQRTLTPPSRFNTAREAFAPLDFVTNAVRPVPKRSVPQGDGRPVILAPGFLSNELSMRGLRNYLQDIGYNAYGWEIGFNDGRVRLLMDKLTEQVKQKARILGRPVTLIGWSLGGVIAREVARRDPMRVNEIITLGSPIVGGPKYTSIAPVYARLYGVDLDAIERESRALSAEGLTQPVTSIYSKSDGIVSWRASVDTFNPQARNIEVGGGHFGLGNNRKVWRIIAETLGRS